MRGATSKFNNNTDALRLSEIFSSLSDPTRLRVVIYLIGHGELCVSDVSRELRLTMPNLSHHLRQLRLAGIVDSRRMGQKICYNISDNPIGKWIRKTIPRLKFRVV